MRLLQPVILLLFLFAQSCKQKNAESIVKHYREGSFNYADSLLGTAGGATAAARFVDSVYAAFPYTSVADQYRYYQFMVRRYNYHAAKNTVADSAVMYTDSMLYLIEKNKLEQVMEAEYANAYRLKGEFYFKQNQYKEAVQAVSMSRLINRQAGDSCTAGENTAILGNITFKQKNYLQAATYFKEAIGLFRHCPTDQYQFYRMQLNLDNAGLSYFRAGYHDSAMKYFNEDIVYIRKNSYLYDNEPAFAKLALTVVYCNIAQVYRAKTRLQEAEKYLLMAMDIFSKDSFDNKETALPHIQLAEVYLDMGNPAKATAALAAAERSLQDMEGEQRLLWFKQMQRLAEQKGDEPGELKYLQWYLSAKDSLNNASQTILGIDPYSEYQQLERKLEVDLLQKTSDIRKTYTLASIFVVVLFVAILLVVLWSFRRSRRREAVTKKMNEDLRQQEQTLKELLLNLEHRKEKEKKDELFLQGLNMQIQYNEAVITQRRKISVEMHDKLSLSLKSLKYYLDDVKPQVANEHDRLILTEAGKEVEAIHDNAGKYVLNLQSAAGENQYNLVGFLKDISNKFSQRKLLHIDLDIDEDKVQQALSTQQYGCLHNIIMECISNIIRHAQARIIQIRIRFTEQECVFSVSDNGKGFDKNAISYGMGLKSIHNRIHTLKGKLDIDTGPGGTTVTGSFSLEQPGSSAGES